MHKGWTIFAVILGVFAGVLASVSVASRPAQHVARPKQPPAISAERAPRPAVRAATGAAAASSSPFLPDQRASASLPPLMQGGLAHPAAAACPAGMQLVEGDFCPYVAQRCVDWIDAKRGRCRRYAPDPRCAGRLRHMSFCIDRYEFPNQKGVYPAVMVDFVQAQSACRAEGKRLCTDQEWTFACEGTELRPYPYGLVRDATACNIDRPYRLPDLQAFSHGRDISTEMSKLDQRVPSGSMKRCVSPFGVYDMTGNVDEWVLNTEEADKPVDERTSDISGLKGGYFGPVRDSCRPMTTDHNRWFRFYQVGFRCCSNPAGSG